MRYLLDSTTDPCFNLAAEQYLLENGSEEVLRLWRNKSSVIIGRYQNAAAEVNRVWVEEHGVPVVRRLSGGGAVFHDLGNINFSFIGPRRSGEDTSAMFRRFTAPIIRALRDLGVPASLEGRNDLTIGGRKFSGCAIAVHRDRVLQHGTLLFSASIADLSAALNIRPEKFAGRAVKSNAARVTNIAEHLPQAEKGMTAEGMMRYLMEYMAAGGNARSRYTSGEMEAITALRDSRYATRQWNWGESPAYTFHNAVRLPCGLVEVCLGVESDIITGCTIFGDFFSLRPVEEISDAMVGLSHSRESIAARLRDFYIPDYFGADISEQLISLVCF